jgi:hypothetical protein
MPKQQPNGTPGKKPRPDLASYCQEEISEHKHKLIGINLVLPGHKV